MILLIILLWIIGASFAVLTFKEIITEGPRWKVYMLIGYIFGIVTIILCINGL